MTMLRKNPSIPLTPQDLRAIARERYNKQYQKRILIVMIPALLALIVVAVASNSLGHGFALLLIGIIVVGVLAGLVVAHRWYDKATKEFATTHAGSYWRKGNEPIEDK